MVRSKMFQGNNCKMFQGNNYGPRHVRENTHREDSHGLRPAKDDTHLHLGTARFPCLSLGTA